MLWSSQSYLEALLAHSKINLFKAIAEIEALLYPEEYTVTTGQALPALPTTVH